MMTNDKIVLAKGRDKDAHFCVEDDNGPVDLSHLTRVIFIATLQLGATSTTIKKDSDVVGEVTLDLVNGKFTVHLKQADTMGITIPVLDHGPFGDGVGPAWVGMPFEIITVDNAGLTEQLVADVMMVAATPVPDLSGVL